MDADKATFLADLEPVRGDLGALRTELRATVAGQITSDDPPEVWATALRLLDRGLERDAVMAQLCMALTFSMQEALAGDGTESADQLYLDALQRLPTPRPAEIADAALDLARGGDCADVEDLIRHVRERLGRPPSDGVGEVMIDRVIESMLDDDGPLALLADDRVVHVPTLTEGIVLTHRLTESEREIGVLTASFDLAGFQRRDDLRDPDGAEVETFSAEAGHVAWHGPEGWLDDFPAGTILAVRVAEDGRVSLDPLADVPVTDPALVALIRSVYDSEVAEPWLPVRAEELVLGTLAEDRDAFAVPRPPLAELCAAADLERRGSAVAHEESVWRSQTELRRFHSVYDALPLEAQQQAALRVLDLAANVEEADPASLRAALVDLADPNVAEVVLEELVATGDAAPVSEALLAAATTSRQTGVARWVAALAAEGDGDALGAEAHLSAAIAADPDWGPIVERCAWYASDRGDAVRAVQLWRRLRSDRFAEDLATVEPFARRSGDKLGRNDPCWCGSKRKLKMCHRAQAGPSLPDRVGWLCRKAVAYLEHGGREARELVLDLAACRAGDEDEDAMLDALGDPIVLDAALTEGAWFASFVEDRSELLPADEALLAESWLLVARTVYEIVDVRPGAGLRVRDLRTGDVLDVRERTLSRDAQPQSLVCGRAVPDGETHQFIGAVLPVAPGRERDVLDLCDEGDPEELCAYVGALYRPPALQTREGEPLMLCQAVIEVADPAEAERVLDGRYERDGAEWIEMHALNEDERILRATMTLEGARLVVSTHSEPRLDRVLGALADALPTSKVISDERTPFDPTSLPEGGNLPPVAIDPASVVQMQDILERRWVDEHVPALGGLTPRQAAADPTRREEVDRLIASFPEAPRDETSYFAMRPARLRELLGL